ncbi:GNAT family N-acetyltransferase [Candidatus Bealeia paramacronuclearis]|uniref:GNAT family N-acetyltransferase n=1 Tax=Candidatus Bealeia paramacronuclearis TaxID=1921001 RepID=A0ABZ2C699_9PROT|nr:GNAT family N-acetyltransferase [Candidatus Bealeia paramacronuclearis]
MSRDSFVLRPAQLNDIRKLNSLIQVSARGLNQNHYTHAQVDSLIRYVFGVDTELIADQTYYVIEENGKFSACGGWSQRKTLFGSDKCASRKNGYLDPKTDPAKIRAFFVHPDFGRKGLGNRLMIQCEEAVKKAGFCETELMSTLPGLAFYRAHGYVGDQFVDYPLPDGVIVQFVKMGKSFSKN